MKLIYPFRLLIAAPVLIALSFLILSVPAYAACPEGFQELSIPVEDPNNPGSMTTCLSKDTKTIDENPIFIFLRTILQTFSVGAGIAVVGGLVVGGIVRMTARANAGQIQKSEEIIRNSIIGLILYIFMFAIINFLIPGGVIRL